MTDYLLTIILIVPAIQLRYMQLIYEQNKVYFRKRKTKDRALDCNEKEKEKCGLCKNTCPYNQTAYDKNNVDYRINITF